MRLLAAADIHGSQYRLNIILQNIERYHPDLVIICGDITQFGPGEVATNFLNQIPTETFAVPGNIDTTEVGDAIRSSKAENIDLRKIEKNGIPFIGIGGTIPSPIRIMENHHQKTLEDVLKKDCVLVTHVPPYKTQDKVFIGYHAGSKELRTLIDHGKPRLVLCGHIHEDPGVTRLHDTVVVNCSIGKSTEGALIEINNDISVDILD